MSGVTLKQLCFKFLLRYRENIPKNINVIYEIPELREEFVSLSKSKNLVDDQFFAVFGDIFIINTHNPQNSTNPHLHLNNTQSDVTPMDTDGDSTTTTTVTSGSTTSTTTTTTINNVNSIIHSSPTLASRNSNSNNNSFNNNNSIHEIDLSLLNRLTDISIQFITKFNHLQHLNLSFCTGIGNDFIKILQSNPSIQLQTLNLHNTNINDQTIHSIVTAYPNIKSLSIGACQNITDVGIKHLVNGKCLSLTHLDISHCRKLNSSSVKNFNFPSLVHLNASWIGSDQVKETSYYKCVKQCPKLSALLISSSNINENELYKILSEAKKPLTHLDISYCPLAITSVDSKTFKYMSHLQSLSLAGCSFKEPILRRILESAPLLKEIDLSYQEGIIPWSFLLYIINDSGILQHLNTINLSQSKVDRFDVETLLHYPSLNIYLPAL